MSDIGDRLSDELSILANRLLGSMRIGEAWVEQDAVNQLYALTKRARRLELRLESVNAENRQLLGLAFDHPRLQAPAETKVVQLRPRVVTTDVLTAGGDVA